MRWKPGGFYIAQAVLPITPSQKHLFILMNMNYLDVNNINKKSDDVLHSLYSRTMSRQVFEITGYSYYHFGAQWVTAKNKHADFLLFLYPKSLAEAERGLDQFNMKKKFLPLNPTVEHAGYMLDKCLDFPEKS